MEKVTHCGLAGTLPLSYLLSVCVWETHTLPGTQAAPSQASSSLPRRPPGEAGTLPPVPAFLVVCTPTQSLGPRERLPKGPHRLHAGPLPPSRARAGAPRWLQAPEMFTLHLPVRRAITGNRIHRPGRLTSSDAAAQEGGPCWARADHRPREGSSARRHRVTSLRLVSQT